MYIDAIIHKLAEVKGDRPIKDFLLATHSKKFAYATLQQNIQAFNPRFINQIIKDYRQYLKLHHAAKKEKEHSIFAANQGTSKKSSSKEQSSSNLTYCGNQLSVPQCICGNTH